MYRFERQCSQYARHCFEDAEGALEVWQSGYVRDVEAFC